MSRVPKDISKIQIFENRRAAFGLVYYAPGGTCGPRLQRECQLVVIHEGSASVEVDGVEHSLVKGEGILLRPGCSDYFAFSREGGTVHSWCQLLEEDFATPFPDRVFACVMPCSPWLLEWMFNGWRAAVADRTVSRPFLVSAVMMAMKDFCQAEMLCCEGMGLPESLVRAQRWIGEHFAESLTLPMVARAAGVSPGHLIALAKQHWGMTPMAFVWHRRVEEAARLLQGTGMSIGEIADQLGFANQFHFSRRFRERFGSGPRSWRQAVWRGAG